MTLLNLLRSYLPIAFSVLFLVVFSFVGMRISINKIKKQPLVDAGQHATSDAYLTHVQAPHVSQALEEAFAEISPDGEILFVGAANEPNFILSYYTINYLGLPRKVWALGCGPKESEPEVMILPPYHKVSGVLYYMRSKPAWMPQGRFVGGLTLVRFPEARTWNTYCSQ